MLDVYFATRYLQLRDEVLDEGEDRSTAFTLERLREEGSLSEVDFLVLSSGYSLLRSIDHNLRLIIPRRSTRLPDPNHAAAKDVATRVGFDSVDAMQETLTDQMKSIRAAYDRILATDYTE
jgi:glutamine synthetase adenylyltransferase